MQKDKFRFTFEKIMKKEIKDDLVYNNYMFYFNKRKKIINILIKLNNKLHFNKESLYLSIHFIDIIANVLCIDPSINFERLNFNKIAIACTLLSSKFTENDPNIPNVKDYDIDINQHYYYSQGESVDELKKLEVDCLILLDHKLNYSTPFDFLKIFFTIGFYFDEDLENFKLFENLKNNSPDNNENKNNVSFTQKINDSYNNCIEILFKLIQESHMFFIKNGHDSFRFVCAIIYLARECFYEKFLNETKNNNTNIKKFSLWPQKMITIYNIKFEEFTEEYNLIKNLLESKEKRSPLESITERKIQIQPNMYNDLDSYKIKSNNRPLSTSNSRMNNFFYLQNQEIYKENVVTLPNKYEDSGSPSLFKFSKERSNKNSELNLHLNYMGYTFTEMNDNNPFANKKSNNHYIKNKLKDLNSNNSSASNFYDSERKVVKCSIIDYNSDLRSSHSSFPGNIENNFTYKNKNLNIPEDSPKNERKKLNLEKFSNLKKNSFTNDQLIKLKESYENKRNGDLKIRKKSLDSINKISEKENFIIDKNKIDDDTNNDIKQNFEKFLNNELNIESINILGLKKLFNPKKEIEEFPNQITSENKNNKEEIKQSFKDIYENKSSENKLRRNLSKKDNDVFYTKLSDYKLKILSERNIRNHDEKTSMKNKINLSTNRLYAANNSYENKLITSDELNFHNFSKINLIRPQNNKNLLDKTKRLLNKNSFENVLDPKNNNDIEGKIYLKKVSDENFQNDFFKSKAHPYNHLAKENETKNSMIIINNNININAYYDDHMKQNYMIEKKYNKDYKIHDNKYSYRNHTTNMDYLMSHRKDYLQKRHELDYNYNIYSKDLKNVENKKDYKYQYDILETHKSNNIYKGNDRCYDIMNEDKYSHIDNKLIVGDKNYASLHYNRNLDFLSKDIHSQYENNSKYDFYSYNQKREKYINKY